MTAIWARCVLFVVYLIRNDGAPDRFPGDDRVAHELSERTAVHRPYATAISLATDPAFRSMLLSQLGDALREHSAGRHGW